MNNFSDAQRDEIKQIFHEAMTEWIRSYGLTAKNILVGLAALFVALAIIGKGIGWLLALIGFTYMK